MAKRGRRKKRAQRATQEPQASSGMQLATPQTYFYPYGPKGKKETPKASDLRRKKLEAIRRLARTVPGRSAVEQITAGVLDMQWMIRPPKSQKDDDSALLVSEWIENSLRRPNMEMLGVWRRFTGAIVSDLLVANRSCIERQPGTIKGEDPHRKVLWAWVADGSRIFPNPAWKPELTGAIPKYFEATNSGNVPIMEESLFEIVHNVNSYERIPPSAMEVAYNMIETWLGLEDYRRRTTQNPTSDWILDIGEATPTDLTAFRSYWNKEIISEGQQPILAGKGQIKAVKFGASDDAALYHQYCEYLLRIIMLAFQLSGRDANISEHDNRATAGESANRTFAMAIKPMAQTIFEALELELVKYYFLDYRLEVRYLEPRSQNSRDRLAIEKFKEGIIKRNESRLELGHDLDETDAGDIYATDGSGSEMEPEPDETSSVEPMEPEDGGGGDTG